MEAVPVASCASRSFLGLPPPCPPLFPPLTPPTTPRTPLAAAINTPRPDTPILPWPTIPLTPSSAVKRSNGIFGRPPLNETWLPMTLKSPSWLCLFYWIKSPMEYYALCLFCTYLLIPHLTYTFSRTRSLTKTLMCSWRGIFANFPLSTSSSVDWMITWSRLVQ